MYKQINYECDLLVINLLLLFWEALKSKNNSTKEDML